MASGEGLGRRPSPKANFKVIEGSVVALSLVSEAIVQDKTDAPESILPFIMKCGSDIGQYSLEGLNFCSDSGLETVFGQLPHCVALARLSDFVSASALQHMVLPAAFVHDSPQIDVDVALLALRMAVVCRNIVGAAAFVHDGLLVPSAASARPADDKLFNEMTWAIASLGELLSCLDEVVSSQTALKAEGGNISFLTPVTLVRGWGKVMSIFSRVSIHSLIGMFVKILDEATIKCKTATPAWKAAITDEGWNHALAKKLLGGRLEATVSAHNNVHAVMGRMSASAKLLSLAPRLQDHDISSQPIAVAFATMSTTMTSAICIMGTDIINNASDPSCAARAAEFLHKYRQHPSSKNLPDVFWVEFEALASLRSLGADAIASSSAMSTSSPAVAQVALTSGAHGSASSHGEKRSSDSILDGGSSTGTPSQSGRLPSGKLGLTRRSDADLSTDRDSAILAVARQHSRCLLDPCAGAWSYLDRLGRVVQAG